MRNSCHEVLSLSGSNSSKWLLSILTYAWRLLIVILTLAPLHHIYRSAFVYFFLISFNFVSFSSINPYHSILSSYFAFRLLTLFFFLCLALLLSLSFIYLFIPVFFPSFQVHRHVLFLNFLTTGFLISKFHNATLRVIGRVLETGAVCLFGGADGFLLPYLWNKRLVEVLKAHPVEITRYAEQWSALEAESWINPNLRLSEARNTVKWD